jgi:hypothetical protein
MSEVKLYVYLFVDIKIKTIEKYVHIFISYIPSKK